LFLNGNIVEIWDYLRDTQQYAIIQTVTSVISLLASIAIIWIINRSYEKLSSTTNRLLLGLCVADILSSLAQSFSTLPAPDIQGLIWNASGSIASCRTQGFFIFVGSVAAPLYNCSMCLYFLSVVKYNKKDAYIKSKIEPFLHAGPIALSLIGAITILAKNAFHPNMTYCFIGSDPTCEGFECDATKRDAKVLFIIFSAAPYIILPCVIATTMIFMYRAVLAQEKKNSKYGVGALKANLRAHANAGCDHGQEENTPKKLNLLVRLEKWFLAFNENKATVSRIKKSKPVSRTILRKALSYSIAFFLTYLFPMIISIRTLRVFGH